MNAPFSFMKSLRTFDRRTAGLAILVSIIVHAGLLSAIGTCKNRSVGCGGFTIEYLGDLTWYEESPYHGHCYPGDEIPNHKMEEVHICGEIPLPDDLGWEIVSGHEMTTLIMSPQYLKNSDRKHPGFLTRWMEPWRDAFQQAWAVLEADAEEIVFEF